MNTPWSDGYVTDVNYTNGFYRDLTPGLLRMALLLHGVDMPKRRKKEPLRYLELGYGQGLSLNIHAAALSGQPAEFWGTDFNPNHALRAGELAQASGAEIHLFNHSFAELAARSAGGDLPQFDIIVMHGVWSWINDENRGHILNILNRNCKTGGVVFLSYNALPGWASKAPLRDILAMHSSLAGSGAQSPQQCVGQAYAFAKHLAETGARYFTANPQATAQLEQLGNMPSDYVIHEYLNASWRPFYFADVARTLSMAKLSFVTSTRLLSQMAAVTLPPEGLQLMAQTENPLLRETLRDFYMNQQFRADVFVKGEHRLTQREQMDRMSALRLNLTTPLEAVSLTIPGPVGGTLTLKEDIYSPILAALADKDYAPKTLEELEDHPLLKELDSAPLIEALTVLTGAGYVHPAQESALAEAAQPVCDRLNAALLERAGLGEACPALASPVLGGGLYCSRLEQLFLLSLLRGGETYKEWGEDAWNTLAGRGEQLMRDGQVLEHEDALKEITEAAKTFLEQRLPFLKSMGVVPPAEIKE